MKKIILAIVLLTAMAVSCDNKNADGTWNVEYSNSPGMCSNPTVIVIDSCEYIKWGYGLTHKGNCKFCEERRRQEKETMLEDIVIELY